MSPAAMCICRARRGTTQLLALTTPAGMLFVPSIGGISHHWAENTKDEDIVLGCQTLATAARLILEGEAPWAGNRSR